MFFLCHCKAWRTVSSSGRVFGSGNLRKIAPTHFSILLRICLVELCPQWKCKKVVFNIDLAFESIELEFYHLLAFILIVLRSPPPRALRLELLSGKAPGCANSTDEKEAQDFSVKREGTFLAGVCELQLVREPDGFPSVLAQDHGVQESAAQLQSLVSPKCLLLCVMRLSNVRTGVCSLEFSSE